MGIRAESLAIKITDSDHPSPRTSDQLSKGPARPPQPLNLLWIILYQSGRSPETIRDPHTRCARVRLNRR